MSQRYDLDYTLSQSLCDMNNIITWPQWRLDALCSPTPPNSPAVPAAPDRAIRIRSPQNANATCDREHLQDTLPDIIDLTSPEFNSPSLPPSPLKSGDLSRCEDRDQLSQCLVPLFDEAVYDDVSIDDIQSSPPCKLCTLPTAFCACVNCPFECSLKADECMGDCVWDLPLADFIAKCRQMIGLCSYDERQYLLLAVLDRLEHEGIFLHLK